MSFTMINASAGSGKTHTLTDRIAEHLTAAPEPGARPVTPSGIIATTFTKRAAAELTERLQQKLLDRGDITAAEQITTALIGTVNSVAGRIVTDYAIDSGLSPRLRVLDEDTAHAAFQAAVDARIAAADAEHADMLHRMEHSRNASEEKWGFAPAEESWAELVKRVADHARSNNLTPEQVRESAESSWQEMLSHLEAFGPESDRDERRGWQALFADCLNDLRSDLLAWQSQGDALTRWPSTGTTGVKRSAGNVAGSLTTLDAFHRQVLARRIDRIRWSDWLRAAAVGSVPVPANGKKPGAHPAAVFQRFMDTVTPGVFTNPQFRLDMHSLITLILHTAADALEDYREHKAQLGVMDFVDQEALALQLLTENERVRASVRDRFQLLAVDEFQDTSPIQLALFLALRDLVDHALWVGDPKQSIYAFRGAAPELMAAVLQHAERTEVLTESYRSSAGPLQLSNTLFSELFHDQAEETVTLSLPESRRHLAEVGGAELWSVKPVAARSATNAALAGAIADGIADLLLRTPELAGKPVTPSDIAVLLRTKSLIPEIIAALAAHGIPAIGAAPDLFSAREAQIVRAGLALLADESDTIALIELVTLLDDHGAHTTWFQDLGAAQDRAARDAVLDQFRADPVLAALRGLRAHASALTAQELLAAVIDALDLPQRIKDWTTPETRLAVLDALRQLAAEYEAAAVSAGAPMSITGLLDHCAAHADATDVHTSADSVLVTTVHQAKGLGWPVVVSVIPEKLTAHRREPVTVVGRPAEEFDARTPLAGRRISLLPWISRAADLEMLIEESETGRAATRARLQEEARVQYVSLTRAKYVSVLVTKKSVEKSILNEMLEERAGVNAAIPEAAAPGLPVRLEVTGPRSGRSDAHLMHYTYTDEEPVVPAAPPERSALAARDLPLRPGAGESTRLPARVRASAVGSAGIDADVRVIATLGEPLVPGGGADWNLVGEAVHAYLATPYAQLPQQARAAVAERIHHRWLGGTSQLVEALAPSAIVEAGERWQRWLESALPGAEQATEVPISHWNEDDQVMEGWVDAMLTVPGAPSGAADPLPTSDSAAPSSTGMRKAQILVDHKTFPNPDEAAIIAHIRENYLGQMSAYAGAIARATGAAPTRILMHFPLAGRVAEVVLDA